MADEFRAYRDVVPPGGVMSALPKAEPMAPQMTDQERAYAEAYAADLRRRHMNDDFRAPSPGPSTMDSLKGGAKGLFESMSLFNLVPEAARAAWSGVTLPGDTLVGKAPPMFLENGEYNPQHLERVTDLTGLVTLGAGAIPAEANTLRAGLSLPTDGKRMFGGVMRTEDEIAKLEARGLTDEELLARRAARGPEAEAKKQRKSEQANLSPTDIPLPLQTRNEGLYSKAEETMLKFNQPNATVAEYIGFLKQRDVKDAEIANLGLKNMDPEQVMPSKGIQDLILQRSPRLGRVEYTGDKVVYKDKVQFHDPDLPGEETVGYREIAYTLPSEQMGKTISRDEFRNMAEEKVRGQIEQARRTALNRGLDVPIVPIEEFENRVQRLMDRYYVQNAAYQKLEHWPDIANPVLHLRVQDKISGNKKIFHVAETQSDLANDIRKWDNNEPDKPTVEPPRNVPWVEDTRDTMDLMAKKIITEAVNSDADFIVLSSPATQIKRWGRGENDKNVKAFEDIYGIRGPAAIDRNAKIAGGGKGSKVTLFDEAAKLTDDDVLRASEDFDYQEILDQLELEPDDPSSFDAWEFGVPYARRAGEDPDFVASEKRFLDSKANNIRQRLSFDDIQDDPNKVQMLEAELAKIEGQLMGLDYAEQIYDMIKERAGQVVRYKIEVTPEMRKFVKERGFGAFAKGGIVDIANYLGWNF